MGFGRGVGDVMPISRVAPGVYTDKDVPDEYRYIIEEVRSLQVLINKATQYLVKTTLNDSDRQHGVEALKGCQSVLQDFDSLIEKYNALAAANTTQVFKRVKLGTEDIVALRIRLISSTTLLNGFIQRFLIFSQLLFSISY